MIIILYICVLYKHWSYPMSCTISEVHVLAQMNHEDQYCIILTMEMVFKLFEAFHH